MLYIHSFARRGEVGGRQGGVSVLPEPISNSQQHPQQRTRHPESGRPRGRCLVCGRGVGGYPPPPVVLYIHSFARRGVVRRQGGGSVLPEPVSDSQQHPQQRTRHTESWRPQGDSGLWMRGGDMKAECCAGIKRIYRKAREDRKDNVVSALRPLWEII